MLKLTFSIPRAAWSFRPWLPIIQRGSVRWVGYAKSSAAWSFLFCPQRFRLRFSTPATLMQVIKNAFRLTMLLTVVVFCGDPTAMLAQAQTTDPANTRGSGQPPATGDVTEVEADPTSAPDLNPGPPAPLRSCVVVGVPLPITLSVGQQIQRSLQVVASKAPAGNTIQNRPVVLLEFETRKTESGSSSDLGACISLAQFLTSPAMSRMQTIAYIPANNKSNQPIKGQLNGHAVLVAIACSQIVMEDGTAIGNAGTTDASDASYIAEVYKGIASQRFTLPVEVVLSMLQKDRGLFRVTTEDQVLFVDEAELKRIESAGQAIETTTLAPASERALLTSQQLQQFRLITYRVTSKAELARKLNLAPDQLSVDASDGGTWTAIAIAVPDVLDQRTARWIVRSINPAIGRYDANLLLLEIEDSVGGLEAGVDLARAIAEINSADVRTVAVIRNSARSGAALAALACDQMILHKGATLGGFEPAPGPNADRPNTVSDAYRESYQDDAQAIAELKDKDWSLLAAMIDDKVELSRYRQQETGEVRLLSALQWESLEDADRWQLAGVIDIVAGINATQLKQAGVVSTIVENDSEIKTIYQLADDPFTLAPTASDRWVQSLAAFLTSPMIASLLIMGAFFLISTEMSAPGLGVPGFLGSLCLLGFFWAQYFDGNAEWFEILLFVIGIVFVLMEIFVIPGFGIFGIGGTIMVCVSIVLAAQSFLVPLNVRDFEQLPNSLFPLVGAGFGIVAAVLLLPRVIPDTPFLRNVILSPPEKSKLQLGGEKDVEATADFAHLLGRRGIAATKLMPSGRAQFGEAFCDVITQGQVVDKGDAVEVIEAVANRVVVKKVSR